jgi:hypothetical protein
MSARRRPTEHAANVEQKVGDLFGDFAFRFGKFGAVPFRFALDAQISGAQEVPILLGFVGRGSWIRTNDLQYPKHRFIVWVSAGKRCYSSKTPANQ